jgi:hypothetical protein
MNNTRDTVKRFIDTLYYIGISKRRGFDAYIVHPKLVTDAYLNNYSIDVYKD